MSYVKMTCTMSEIACETISELLFATLTMRRMMMDMLIVFCRSEWIRSIWTVYEKHKHSDVFEISIYMPRRSLSQLTCQLSMGFFFCFFFCFRSHNLRYILHQNISWSPVFKTCNIFYFRFFFWATILFVLLMHHLEHFILSSSNITE